MPSLPENHAGRHREDKSPPGNIDQIPHTILQIIGDVVVAAVVICKENLIITTS
jgi:hypothetical protein